MKKNPSPASEAKIDANRENAKKSTGPRTDAGKEASSRNGLKHGLCADKHLLPGEQPDDLCAHLQNLLDTFRPVGEGEEKLVLRIAAAQWRLDRAFPMEAGILRERFHDVAAKDTAREKQNLRDKAWARKYRDPEPPPLIPPNQGDLVARAFDADCAGPNSISKLVRYEGALERSIDRSLRQLKAFQAARLSSSGSGTPPAPPKKENCEANPNSPPGATEGSVEILHPVEDVQPAPAPGAHPSASCVEARLDTPFGGPRPFDNPCPAYLE